MTRRTSGAQAFPLNSLSRLILMNDYMEPVNKRAAWITQLIRKGKVSIRQQQYTTVTGRQPMPPDFILGYQQSKLRYYEQTQIMDLAQCLHDEQVSVSMIVTSSTGSIKAIDPELMAATVGNLTGAEMMVSLWPSVEGLSADYLALQEQGFPATTRDGTGISDSFTGVYTRVVDSTNPGAREFLWNQWFDLGLYKLLTFFFELSLNISLAQQAISEGLHHLTNSPASSTSCDYMLWMRSTFAGGHRPRQSAHCCLGHIVLDIGGFTGLDISTDYGKELYVSWLGMGTFSHIEKALSCLPDNGTLDFGIIECPTQKTADDGVNSVPQGSKSSSDGESNHSLQNAPVSTPSFQRMVAISTDLIWAEHDDDGSKSGSKYSELRYP
ncbi:hypothetical protein BJ138DRAFT_1118076 [Hygrophoropsis aurantiaca]|uniref:Uncharacterized protein n=1 Tax=Hygrophoropsis aurantiaca TaxID=72124 RepID=A0ACB7ZYZ2_9AGAM|nr:hypothetical protein BJ138DRAFT_1118076 [Hygrophoropsis aurantiaca]